MPHVTWLLRLWSAVAPSLDFGSYPPPDWPPR
jgi:hypothetical protein